MGVVLLGVGLAIAYVGTLAIRDRHFAINFTESRTRSIGIPGLKISETERHEGTNQWSDGDAVLLGASFAALGLMFLVWSAGLLLFPRESQKLIFASLFCLATALLLGIPPWKWSPNSAATGCYAALLAFSLFEWAHFKRIASARTLGTILVLAFVGTVLGIMEIPPPTPVPFGIVIGVFGWVLIRVHVVLLGQARKKREAS